MVATYCRNDVLLRLLRNKLSTEAMLKWYLRCAFLSKYQLPVLFTRMGALGSIPLCWERAQFYKKMCKNVIIDIGATTITTVVTTETIPIETTTTTTVLVAATTTNLRKHPDHPITTPMTPTITINMTQMPLEGDQVPGPKDNSNTMTTVSFFTINHYFLELLMVLIFCSPS